MPSWQTKILKKIIKMFVCFLQYQCKKKQINTPIDRIQYIRKLLQKFMTIPKKVNAEFIQTTKFSGTLISIKGHTPSRTILFLHGGGYIIGLNKSYINFAYYLAKYLDARVLLLDYRLAPEYTYPSAVEDALNAYDYLLNQGIHAKQIIICGDSAGGGLAVSLLLKLQTRPSPMCGICISPWFDLACESTSITYNQTKDYILSPLVQLIAPQLQQIACYYLGDTPAHDPIASPLYAELNNLPPLLIQVGSLELFLDDAQRFTDKAKQAASNVILEIWPNMPHDWPIFVPFLPESKQALQQIAAYLNTVEKMC